LFQGWSTTGYMNYARRYHTSSLLSNGNVLVAGGQGYAGVLLVDSFPAFLWVPLNYIMNRLEYGHLQLIWHPLAIH